MRGNTFVYPSYKTSTPDWWQGVVGYGYTAALTGDFKFFIWGEYGTRTGTGNTLKLWYCITLWVSRRRVTSTGGTGECEQLDASCD
jgi:hypothetical protein